MRGEAQNVNFYSSCVTHLSNVPFLVLPESRPLNIKYNRKPWFWQNNFWIVITINDWPLLQYKERHGPILYGYVAIILFKNSIFIPADSDHSKSDVPSLLGWQWGEGTVTLEMIFINAEKIYTILLPGKNKKASFIGSHKAGEREKNRFKWQFVQWKVLLRSPKSQAWPHIIEIWSISFATQSLILLIKLCFPWQQMVS